MNRRIEYMCPHCGWRFDALLAKDGAVPVHKWEPEPRRSVRCPGSEQAPRNLESDKRPLWKDLPEERRSHEQFEWSDLPADWAMRSHGHVAPRPDGVLARCGGPALCPTCQLERHYLKLLESYRKATTPRHLAVKQLALDIIEAIGGDRKFWAETQGKTVARVEQMLLSSKVTT